MSHLIAITSRDFTFRVGQYDSFVPAGTEVLVRTEAIESGARVVYTAVADRPRCTAILPVAALLVP